MREHFLQRLPLPGHAPQCFCQVVQGCGAHEISVEADPAEDAAAYVHPHVQRPAGPALPVLNGIFRIFSVIPLPGAVSGIRQFPYLSQVLFGQRDRAGILVHQFPAQGVPELFDGGAFRQIIFQISHPAAHGFRALGSEFGGIGPQGAGDHVPVGIEQQRAVVEDASLMDPLGNTGDLLSVHQDIVPAGGFRRNSHGSQRPAYRLGKPGEVLQRRVSCVGNEGIIEISEIVIHGSAAGHAAHHGDAVFFHKGGIHFLRRVLIAADDDSVGILPQHEPVTLGPMLQDVLLKGQVIAGIRGSRFKIKYRHVSSSARPSLP